MVWRNPQNPKEGLAPLYHTVENNTYKNARNETPQEREQHIRGWLGFLCNMWGEKSDWWLSGAVAISCHTGTYPRTHTNTDIAVLSDPELFRFMVEKAQENSLYLLRMVRSYKRTWSKNDLQKYEVYSPPITAEQAIQDVKRNRNLQFCAVDHNGNIITENRMYDRIKVYFHDVNSQGKIVSREDSLPVQTHWLGEETIHRIRSGNLVRTVNMDYLIALKKRMLTSWRWRRNPKHTQDLERMLQHAGKKDSSFSSSSQSPLQSSSSHSSEMLFML